MRIFFFATLIFTVFLLQRAHSQDGTVNDIEGNEYPYITIGNLQWLTANLRSGTYANGDPITTNLENANWATVSEGAYAIPQLEIPVDEYGHLYNWFAVTDARGICPTGWNVPTESHWENLSLEVDPAAWGNKNFLGTKLKDQRQVDSPMGDDFDTDEHPRWDSHTGRHGTNDYGFAALPAGIRAASGEWGNLGQYAYFWSATPSTQNTAFARILLYTHAGASKSAYSKNAGLSVRCVREVSGNDDDDDNNTLPSVTVNGITIYIMPTDVPLALPWGGDGTTTGATSETDGKINTPIIIDALGDNQGVNYAARACDDLSAHGFEDWYLPSKDELNALYLNREDIGGFVQSLYWSSTEFNHRYAWYHSFSMGFQDYEARKFSPLGVRCVRKNQ